MLKNLINDAMRERLAAAEAQGKDHPDENPADIVQQIVVDLLKENAIRGEVYEAARFMNGASDSFSVVDVHNVLDALIASLEGSDG